jgi:hypothetical protein
MKRIYLSVLCAGFLFAACRESHVAPQLTRTVTSFFAPITGIGRSEYNDSLLFVGLESGNILIKNIYTDEQLLVDEGGNRVYDVKEYAGDTLLLGIRDEGLKAVVFDRRRGPSRIVKQYTIDKKDANYGVYHIARYDHLRSFVLGTSNGCYTLDSAGSAVLRPFHSQLQRESHFGFNKLLSLDSRLLMASDKGLIIESGGVIVDTLLPGCEIADIFCKDSLLYIAAKDNGVFRTHTGHLRDSLRSHSLHTAYAFVKDALDGEWTVGSNQLVYRPHGRMPVVHPLPQGASLSGKQIVCADANFVWLACGHQLVTFPVHQNVDGERGSVIALGRHDDSTAYFLTGDNKLYRYRTNDSLARRMGTVKGLEVRDNVVQSELRNGFFWVATDKTLLKIDIDARRLVSATPINPPGRQRNDIRRLFFDNDTTLYVGTRLDLQVVNPSTGDTLRTFGRLQNPQNDLYVTALCRIGNTLYIGTLNKGLFALRDGSRGVDTLLVEKYPYGNIRNLVAEDGRLYVHTSKGLYRYEAKDRMTALPNVAIDVSKYIRSVAADTGSHAVAIIGNHGFARLDSLARDTCRRLSYEDITFHNASLAFLDGPSWLLGTRTGLFRYDGRRLTSVGLEPETFIAWGQYIIGILVTIALIMTVVRPDRTHRRRLNDFLRRIARNREAIERRVLDPSAKTALLADALRIEHEAQRWLRRLRPLSAKETNRLSDELHRLDTNIGRNAVSGEEMDNFKRDMRKLEEQLTDKQEIERQSKIIIHQLLENIKADLVPIEAPDEAIAKEKDGLIAEIEAVYEDITKLKEDDVQRFTEKVKEIKIRVAAVKQKEEAKMTAQKEEEARRLEKQLELTKSQLTDKQEIERQSKIIIYQLLENIKADLAQTEAPNVAIAQEKDGLVAEIGAVDEDITKLKEDDVQRFTEKVKEIKIHVAAIKQKEEAKKAAQKEEEARRLEKQLALTKNKLTGTQELERQSKIIIHQFLEEIKNDLVKMETPDEEMVKEKTALIAEIDKVHVDIKKLKKDDLQRFTEKVKEIKISATTFKQKEDERIAEQKREQVRQQQEEKEQRAEQRRELERQERLAQFNARQEGKNTLDLRDLEIIEVLANPHHPLRNTYLKVEKGKRNKWADLMEVRQANKIASALDCDNKRYYIVAAAFREGLLSLKEIKK